MRRTVVGIMAAIALAALAGCGSDSSETMAAPSSVAESTVTSTEDAATTSAGVTWNYLRSEYADFLTMSCEDKTGPSLMACVGLMNTMAKTFAVDVEELAPSQARSSVLTLTEQIDGYDDKLVLNQCGANPDSLACAGTPGLVTLAHSGIVTVVTREAAAE